MSAALRIGHRLLPPPGPLRLLTVSTTVSSAGSALLITTLVLYFARHVGLTGGQVGVGLTLGGAAGLLVGVPLGHLADRRGAREVAIALVLLQSVATASYVFARSFLAFVVCACAVVALTRGAGAVEQGLIARVLPESDRLRGRAYLNAVQNVGFALGSGLATIGIALDSADAYRAMILADAASYLGAAACLAALPRMGSPPLGASTSGRPSGPGLVVLRDRPFLAVVGLTGVLAIQVSMLDVGFPLWLSGRTSAPHAVIGVVFVMNCVLVAAFAVRMSRGNESIDRAARTARWCGVSLVVACALVAAAGDAGPTVATALLVGGMLAQAVAEMQCSMSGWGLSFGLAPEDLQGQYQGAASTGYAFATTVGPLLMAGVVALGAVGWLLFGMLMLAAGIATVPVVRRAAASRSISGDPSVVPRTW